MGILILIVTLGIEIGFMVYCLRTKDTNNSKKHTIRLITFALFGILTLVQVLEWSFRWQMLSFILLIQAIIGIVFFVRKSKTNKTYKMSKVILSCINRCLMLAIAIIPAILFPQFEPVAATGDYLVKTESYTLTDSNRRESYSDNGDNRKVSIQFWYPDTGAQKEKYPLVIFSHGSFGFRGSNLSTFMDLASNGYVVCSIDHTYQAFYTSQEDGKTVIVNNAFLNDAVAVQNGDFDDKKIYELTHDWLKLRTDDMNLVLDTILENVKKENSGTVYKLIDTDKIGLTGHSLGGATAAELGRTRKDIDAVIVVDGTMIGEEINLENGKSILNQEPYKVPLLNLYNEEHYKDALENAKEYGNMVASANAVDARNVVFKGAGHLNFTDLPLFSPFLAQMLGKGEIDSRYCIETMNELVLNYFDYYLKGTGKLNILNEY